MPNKIYIHDGQKTSLLWDENSTAWTYYSNAQFGAPSYFSAIPTIYRGISMIANDAATMPFVIKRGDTVIDTSQEYTNALEFLPNPRKLFGLLSMSLDLCGRAYAMPVYNKARYVKELRYVASMTIEPEFNQQTGTLDGFIRQVNTNRIELQPEDLLYFWLSDPEIELGPPLAYPFRAALAAAGVLYNLDEFIAAYFKRGMIRPFVVGVSGKPGQAERERMESWFNHAWSGIKKAFTAKVFEADAVNIQQVGDGLDQLQNTELTQEKRQDIAHALGIPYAMLFSEAASNATLGGDQINYYHGTVEPRCEFIASVFQEQLFIGKYKDYRIEFLPESLDIYQEDESARADSLTKYVNVGFPLLMACDILGIELTEEQRAELESMQADKEQRAEELTANLTGQQPQEEEPEEEEPEEDEEASSKATDLDKWRRKSIKAIKHGRSAVVKFESDIIPVVEQERIRGDLASCKTVEDVIAVFSKQPQPQDAAIILEAIRLGVEALKFEPAAA